MPTQNPGIARGVLNRVKCSVVVPSSPSLNIISANMGRSLARIAFEGQLVNQIPTGTGLVNSPEPFVIATITIALLRTQAIAAAWFSQILLDSNVEDATIYSDTSTFPPIALQSVVASHMDPGPFDGTSPDFQLVLRGALPINNRLWTF
ncbi:hypothetical protein [Paraburkholderia caffeinilytica]|uniref:hypothetical protein n=1 Tax=Paraburkholderia caffeinilytica TaxID=1761016 RepID=UPI0038BB473B